MAFSISWDEANPTKNSAARDLDVYIRDLRIAIRERLAVEHNFLADEAEITYIGQHKKGTGRINFGPVAERPAVNADNPGRIYVQIDSVPVGKTEYDNGTEWVELFHLDKTAVPVIEAGDTAGQLSGWAFSGVTLSNTNEYKVYWKLTNSGTDRTLELFKNSDGVEGNKVAAGTRAGDGVLSFTPVNDSGLSGEVAVVYTVDDTDLVNNILTIVANTLVQTDVNGKLAFDILGSSQTTKTIPEHTHDSPVGSLGLLYPTIPFITTMLNRTHADMDFDQWLTVGPTGSGATVICSALDAVPANARGILIQGYIEVVHDSTTQLGGAQVKVRPVGSGVSPMGFLYNYSYSPSETLRVTGAVNTTIDANRLFEFMWNKTVPLMGITLIIKLYYGGYYL